MEETAQRQRIAEETAINDELLTGINAAAEESTSESNASEVAEVIFTGRISPLVKAYTPEVEALRKRTLTLVMRTPDKPRAPPVAPTMISTSTTFEAQSLHYTPLQPTELPASTAPARLDGRTRREGKNSVYMRAIAIERGRGRGGRGKA
jgi:hypothetical protein